MRDAEAGGIEVLLVRRNRALAFAGGFWVFPGGAVDAEDLLAAGSEPDEAPRFAAAREAAEEAGISPDPSSMVLVSHWTTPVGEVKRFSTWFYAAAVPEDCEVRIDRDEIHDWRFIRIADALRAHRDGQLPMLPPTFITLCALGRYGSAEEALRGEQASPCPHILPRMVPLGEEEGGGAAGGAVGEGAGMVAGKAAAKAAAKAVAKAAGTAGFATLYPGDVAYGASGSDRLNDPGPRHRAVLLNGAWHYTYEGVSDEPSLYPLD
jgi:8-oxo-dGTP pyrophosphatase MutT (NUDIX family)